MQWFAKRHLGKVMRSLVCGLALALIDGHAAGQCALTKLLAPDAAMRDRFGQVVSISGTPGNEVIIVGADGKDDGIVLGIGSAYIYRFNGTNWVLEQQLTASDGEANDGLGTSVSISSAPGNEVAIAGADGDDDFFAGSGSAYIYRFNDVTLIWDEEQKLHASNAALNDKFGKSASISGDLAVVGSRRGDGLVVDSGTAYIYRYNLTTLMWDEEAILSASDGAAGDQFGWSVSISSTPGNEVVIVGAKDDGNGSAYIYRFNGVSWGEEQKLTASDGAAQDSFGYSVSISGAFGNEVANVGAIRGDGNVTNSGSAYIYRFNGASWDEEDKLIASDGAADDQFGRSVSIIGAPGNEIALVGAIQNNEPITDPGSAYIYRRSGGIWGQESKLLAPDGAVADEFGVFVSIGGTPGNELAIVGANEDDDNGTSSGSAYIFTELFNPVLFGDCNDNGIVDCQDITAATSLDVNVNGIPDECEATIDNGATALINPTGSTGAPVDEPLVEVTNVSGGAGETVTVSVSNDDLHPGTSGFAVVGSTASVSTSMADGEFFMTITMPFKSADLAGADWTTVDLLYFNTATGLWELAVAANTVGGVGARFEHFSTVDITLASLSSNLGDYGVFWNTATLRGFAWANVDHTSDYTAGIALCLADFTGPGNVPDGQVNVTDLLALLAAWGPNPGNPADFTGPGDVPDGLVNVTDLLALLGAWGACP